MNEIEIRRQIRDCQDLGTPRELCAAQTMTAVLERYAGWLPTVGAEALVSARAVWIEGRKDLEGDLLVAQNQLHRYMHDRNGSSTAIVDSGDRVIRALLCVLSPSQLAADFTDLLEWFELMLESVEERRAPIDNTDEELAEGVE